MSTNPNPFGSPNPYGGQNPYSSPSFAGPTGARPPLGAKLMAPAVGLLITGILGILFSIASVVMSFGPPPPIDPAAPPFLQEFQKGSHGPIAAVIQGVFILVNGFIIFGAVQMMRQKMRGLAIAASVVAMVNFGNAAACWEYRSAFGAWPS